MKVDEQTSEGMAGWGGKKITLLRGREGGLACLTSAVPQFGWHLRSFSG